MRKLVALLGLFLIPGFLMAGLSVPEVGADGALTAVVLLGGAVLVIRARRGK